MTELAISYVGYETEVTTIGPVIPQNNDSTPEIHNFSLKEGVVYINSESFSKAKQPPHPVKQPDHAKSGEKIFFIVEKMPEYPGAFYALGQYVTELQKKVSRNKNLSGKAMIGFTVDPEGKVTDVNILDSDSELVGKEAAKIVMNMADWKPGAQRGVTVPVNFVIRIVF